MQLSIIWIDPDDMIHKGINEYAHNEEPIWTINSKQTNNSNPKDGRLTLNPDKTKATIYTAPNKIPSANPVSIAVSFKTNDSSKEKTILICNVKIVNAEKKWFVTFTSSEYSSESITGSTEFKHTTSKSGSASMIVKSDPPDKSGNALINTGEGDSVSNYSTSVNYSDRWKRIDRDINGSIDEKTLRKFTGKTNKKPPGIEFTYDSSPNGFGISLAEAGFSFDVSGISKFWNQDIETGKLKFKGNDVSNRNEGIMLGHAKDVIKRSGNGYTVDYTNTKDTSYTDHGDKHILHSTETYHVTISWINANNLPGGKGKKED
jgi:hypothetical protein